MYICNDLIFTLSKWSDLWLYTPFLVCCTTKDPQLYPPSPHYPPLSSIPPPFSRKVLNLIPSSFTLSEDLHPLLWYSLAVPPGADHSASCRRFSPQSQCRIQGRSTTSGIHDGYNVRILFVTVVIIYVMRVCLGAIESGWWWVYFSIVVEERGRRRNVHPSLARARCGVRELLIVFEIATEAREEAGGELLAEMEVIG